MSDLVFRPAHQLAQMIRERTVSATEVLEAVLSQIAKYNTALNAVVTLNQEQARARAKAADKAIASGEIWGALHGVPFTAKDNIETAGIRTTASYKPLVNNIPQQDATVVARLHSAGAILLGKTNLPKLGEGLQTKSPLFGRTNNPWNLDYTCGGSTGGGAAAVAAGLSPLELGNDGAGSIRIPAHFCGVLSLKPTEHRVSMAGTLPPLPGKPRSLRYQLTPGIMARSVEDLQLCLSLIEGADNRHWEIAPVSEIAVQPRPLKKYRFAWTDTFGNVPVTVETRLALQGLADKLTHLGCQVEYLTPPEFDFEQAWQAFGEIAATEIQSKVSGVNLFWYWSLSLALSSSVPGGALTRGFVRGVRLSLRQMNWAMTQRDKLITILEQFLQSWDIWICPVCPTPAFLHCWTGKRIEVDRQKIAYLVGGCAFTSLFNFTGSPVVVIPIGQTKNGLPIGVQLVGQRWQDYQLLAIAEQLSQITGGFSPPPGF